MKPVLAMTASLLLAGSSFAGINQFSIGLNLGADGGNNPGTGMLNPTDIAGLPAVAQGNWNNLSTVSGAAANVTDNNGNPTSAGVACATLRHVGGSWTAINGGYTYPLPGGPPLPHLTAYMSGATPAGGNVGFLDGHVEWKKFNQMQLRTSNDPEFWF